MGIQVHIPRRAKKCSQVNFPSLEMHYCTLHNAWSVDVYVYINVEMGPQATTLGKQSSIRGNPHMVALKILR